MSNEITSHDHFAVGMDAASGVAHEFPIQTMSVAMSLAGFNIATENGCTEAVANQIAQQTEQAYLDALGEDGSNEAGAIRTAVDFAEYTSRGGATCSKH